MGRLKINDQNMTTGLLLAKEEDKVEISFLI